MFKGVINISGGEFHPVKGFLMFGKEKRALVVFGMKKDRGEKTVYCSVESPSVMEYLASLGYAPYNGNTDFKFDVADVEEHADIIVGIGISKDIRDSMTYIKYIEFLYTIAEKAFPPQESDITIN